MNFNLKRPCRDCPFRTDHHPFLGKDRAQEIGDSITRGDMTFSCHKTNIWAETEDGDAEVSEQPEHCAGAAILLEKLNEPNQWMRIMERLGFYDRAKLDMKAPVFDTVEQFVEHHS